MKNILKWEYDKGKHVSQFIFHLFFMLLILILRLFFLVNFPGKKLSKIKSNKENVLALYRKLVLASLFLIKIEGLTLRIYWSSHWRYSRKKVFLEIAAAIFKNILKTTLKLPCESVVRIPEEYICEEVQF